MSSISPEDPKSAKLVPSSNVEEGYVVLPYSKEEFKDFIRSLLGSPQAISRSLMGPYEITPDEIRNIHQLLTQRIRQQNDATLAKVEASIAFDDGSTVELNSIEDLLTYNEVRPVVSESLHVRWDWLVKFQDKQVPEKQSIQLSFLTADDFFVGALPTRAIVQRPRIHVRIEYTARTWGNDIESLLSNHLQHLIQKEGKIREFLHANSGWFSLLSALVFIVGSLVGAFAATRSFSDERTRELRQFFSSQRGVDIVSLNTRVERIGELYASGIWSQYYFGLAVFLLISVILGILLGIWIESSLSNKEPSYVLFSKQAFRHKTEILKRLQKKWHSFLFALVMSIVTGVAGNLVFRALFE